VAACPPLRLIVVPALDPAAPGPAEKPPGPLESPPARLRWWVIVLAVGGAAAVIGWWWRTRQPAPPPPTPPARAGAGARARLRLRWLQERLAVDAEIESWFHVELSSLLRDYVADRFGVNAPSLSTQEFLGGIESQRALEPAHLALLEDVFLTCDAVKFAGGRATQAERRRLLADAEGFVRETAEDPGPDPPVSGGEATP
jgi:hypothetical protein